MANTDNQNDFTAEQAAELENLSFEDAMARLETLVSGMERGAIPLEESIKSYEEGTRLVKYCQTLLDSYSKKIVESAGGELVE